MMEHDQALPSSIGHYQQLLTITARDEPLLTIIDVFDEAITDNHHTPS